MTPMNGNIHLFWAVCLLAGRILPSEAQQIEMTTRVFQQGAQDYEGTFQVSISASGLNTLGDEVGSGVYYLDGSPFANEGDDTVDVLRFDDIFGEASWQIPENATILSASIGYTTGSDVNAASIGPYQVAKLTEAVDDLTFYDDWALDPPALRGPRSAAMFPFGAGVGRMTGQTRFSIDVTEYVASWKSGEPNHGVLLFANDTIDGLQVCTISNQIVENRPSLSVTFTTAQVEVNEYHPSRSAWLRSRQETVDGSTVEVATLAWAEGDIAESLLYFDLFGDADESIVAQQVVLGASLVLQTAGSQVGDLPDYSADAGSRDIFEVAQMLLDWDETSSFGKEGPNQLNGANGLAMGQFRGMGQWSRATADVTEIVQNWKAGQPNLGLNVSPAMGSANDWQIFFSGTSLPEFKPTLRVWTVRVPGLPSAVASADVTNGKAPLKVGLDASQSSDPDGGVLTYLWDLGDGTISTASSLNHTFGPGVYDVSLTVTDSDGNEARSLLTIRCTGSPLAVFSMNVEEGIEPLPVLFDASDSSDPDGGPVHYQWDFGDGHSAEGAIAPHVYQRGGTFLVKLTVTDDEGDATVVSKSIQVWETSLQYASFQEGVGGYQGTSEQIVRANGSIDLGQDREESYLDGRPHASNHAANDAVELIRFDDIIGNQSGQIPANATILQAHLTFHTGSDEQANADGPYLIGFLIKEFDGSTDYETFDDGSGLPDFRGPRGGVDTRLMAGYAAITNQQVVSANIVEHVQRWVNGETNHGLAIFTNDTNNGWQICTIGHRKPHFRPKLEVVFTTAVINSYQPPLQTSMVAAKDPAALTLDGSFLEASFLDGGGERDYKEGLFKFQDIVGEGPNRIGLDERILGAFLVLHTAGVPDATNDSDTDDPYTVHQMLQPWSLETHFGPSGVSIEDQQASEMQGVFLGMGENSQAMADVTAIVENWQKGDPDHGFVIKPDGTDGWQFWWGDSEEALLPRLLIYTEKALPQPIDAPKPFIALSSDGVILSLDTQAGQSYRVQSSHDLKQWEDQELVQGDGSALSLPRTSDQPKEFFRIVVE